MSFFEPVNLGSPPIVWTKDSSSIDDTESYGYISGLIAMGKGNDDIYSFTKARLQSNNFWKVINSKSKVKPKSATINAMMLSTLNCYKQKTDENGNYKSFYSVW
jgi:hypothetical protein